jgi:hypothetical protein
MAVNDAIRRTHTILASSSMALDVYSWLAQRLHRVPPGRPQMITWAALHEQFGQGFARVRDFRRRFLQTLHQVQAAYPNARLSASDVGLTLENSPPPVPRRYAGGLPGATAALMPPSHGNLVAPPAAAEPAAAVAEGGAGEGADQPDKSLNSVEAATVS